MLKPPFYYIGFNSILGGLFSIWLTLVYSCLATIRMITELIRNGPKAYFSQRDRNGPNRPKILDTVGSHCFISLKRSKIRLHYVEAGNKEKQIMLFVHGFPECWFSWRFQMEEFKHDYHTIAVNMRGYGESDKPIGVENYSTNLIVDDVIEFIETIQTKSHPKIILVAHDWGGAIAYVIAHNRPDLIDRFIVMNAPHPYAWIQRVSNSWQQFFSSWYVFFFNLPFLAEFSIQSNDFQIFDRLFGKYSQSEGDIDVYKHYFSQPYGISGPLNYYRAMLRGYGSNSKGYDNKIQPKTLILWGRDDVALVSDLAHDSSNMCVNARVEYLDQCSHWIQIHRPMEVNSIMKKFLRNKKNDD